MGTEASPVRFAGAPYVRAISTYRQQSLTDGWRVARVAAGTASTLAEMDATPAEWHDAVVPGTVASAMRRAGRLPALEQCEDFDTHDWWFRCRFPAHAPGAGERCVLHFAGLATLAEVWIDGARRAESRNMYRTLTVDVDPTSDGTHEVALRFAALRPELHRPRPRPRWRTGLVEHQALRRVRTTLLGRMPGWCPPVRPVGPWQPVRLEYRRTVELLEGDVMPMPAASGDTLVADVRLRMLGGARLSRAELVTAFGRAPLDISQGSSEEEWRIAGVAQATGAARWWPHTHGGQPRYAVSIALGTSDGPVAIDLGAASFRTVVADRSHDGFTLVVNGVRVFCRGANWTPIDIVTLRASDVELRRRLALLRGAGMNMLRVSGVMTYEDLRFHQLCDELGILVWQDFMFARMDYPSDDAAFMTDVQAEAADVIAARRRFASTAVWCGNSEVAQTAAMLGLEPELWTNPLFTELLPATLAASGHDAPYLPGTPTGHPLPFTPSSGTAHYFGVGAMLRPLDDARRAGVRFAAEALGFSNVPERSSLVRDDLPELPSDPRWAARIPRDAGAAWDFEDVRDHYARLLFDCDPVALRRTDPERYVEMARVTSAEVMRRTFAEWRRSGSSCSGALVWTAGDLWGGPCWGIIDASGRPKSPWYALRRVLAPRAVFFTDEGLNGLLAHVANDTGDVLEGSVELTLHRDGRPPVAAGTRDISVAPHTTLAIPGDAILGRFSDIGWSYRFGPPAHDVVAIELRDRDGTLLGTDLYLPQGLPSLVQDVPLDGHVVCAGNRDVHVEIGSDRLAYAVHIEAGEWIAMDNYVHVAPGRRVTVRICGDAESRPATITARPFNGRSSLRLEVPPAPAD
jgi:beta-mannosidase